MDSLFGNAARWLISGLALLCCLPGVAVGLPAGGIITAGSGSITGFGATLTITPDAPGAIIDWPGFSIGAGETVNIIQPSPASTILLRASGVDPSQILGALQSNGRVFLINPAGIQFGASSVTEAAGLLASTLGLSDQNFLANQLQFASGVGSGALSNEGSITAAPGGSVYLVSPSIGNSGVISAPQGGILLAAGTMVDLTGASGPKVSDAAGAAVSQATNNGQLLAHDGKIGVYAGLVNQNGTVNVDAVVSGVGGTITFSTATDMLFAAANSSTGAITSTSSGASIGAITLGALSQTYSGAVPSATCATVPANLATSISYSDIGSGPLSKNVGNYGVTCTVTQPGYSGSVSGTLTITPALLTINVASGVNVYDGTMASGVLTGSVIPGVVASDALAPAISISSVIFPSEAGLFFNPNNNPDTLLILPSSVIGLSLGWNIIGNSASTPLDVAVAFGDATQTTSVWKWVQPTSKWAFYTPSLTAADLATYAASKGYDVLTTINGGEGFWVDAKVAGSVNLPAGNALFCPLLATGWNLIATSGLLTPSQFNFALSATQPAAGTIPQNITTLWAWDSAQSKWYFYAPGLEAQGGTALADYIAAKGYLDFTSNNKTLGPGVGFWMNKP